MAKLTPFGIALRKLRIGHEMRLFDLAEKIGKSTAMISAIETGRKQIPDGFVAEVVRALGLTSAEHRELRAAKEKTKKEVSVEHLPPEGRELVAAFARNSGELPSQLLEQIRRVVLKSDSDDVPFKRRRRGILVPPMSRAKIEEIAGNLRAAVKCESTPWFPVIEFIEFGLIRISKNFSFEVWDGREMGADEGRVLAGHNTLILREDVYADACRHGGRGRFTAAHELGHYILHHEVVFARASGIEDPIYCDAEWQADVFAGHLMIPRQLALDLGSPESASAAFGTSVHAATVMLAKYCS